MDNKREEIKKNLYNIFKIDNFTNTINYKLFYDKFYNYFKVIDDDKYLEENFIDILNEMEIEKDISHHMRYILKFNNKENDIVYLNNRMGILYTFNYLLFTFYDIFYYDKFNVINQRKDFIYKLYDLFIDKDNQLYFFMLIFLNYASNASKYNPKFYEFIIYEFLNYYKDMSEEFTECFINNIEKLTSDFYKITIKMSEYFKDYPNVVKLAFKFIDKDF